MFFNQCEQHLVERSQALEKEEEEEEEEDSDVIHWNVDFSRRVNSHNFGEQSFERPNWGGHVPSNPTTNVDDDDVLG